MRPAFSTLHKDAVVFNHVIRHAIEHMRMVIPNPPKLKFDKKDEDRDTRRPRFSPDEMRRLLAELGGRAVRRQKQNYSVYYHRNLLWFLVRFLHETGLRPSEVMWLQCKHLAGRGKGLRVAVAKDNLGLKQLMHARNVIPTSGLSATILELFIFYAHEGVPWLQPERPDNIDSPMAARYSHFPKDFWLWSHPDGSRIESMDHSFANALKDLGMEKHEGKRRSLYSLRHTYASEQIEMGGTRNGVGLLCSNLGTSEAMLRKHYGQALFELLADDLQISEMPSS
jgi:integrase